MCWDRGATQYSSGKLESNSRSNLDHILRDILGSSKYVPSLRYAIIKSSRLARDSHNERVLIDQKRVFH